MQDPAKGFPKGIIAMAIMVVVCAILGTMAMGMMFDPAVINSNTETFNSYAEGEQIMGVELNKEYIEEKPGWIYDILDLFRQNKW